MKIHKILIFILFLILFSSHAAPSHAYWRSHTYVDLHFGGPYYGYYYPYYDPYYDPYYYPYYTPPYVVSTTTYEPIVINGTTYYLNNGVYYIYTQYGYQAVPTPLGAPSATVTTATTSGDTFTVNVPNDKGGYTPVLLKKSGTGYLGPQGEFYSDFPKISQLKAMYGK